MKGIFSDIDGTIADFLTSFDRLQKRVEDQSYLSIEASVLRVAEGLTSIGA